MRTAACCALFLSAALSAFGCAHTPSAMPAPPRPPHFKVHTQPSIAQNTALQPDAGNTLIYACEFTANVCVWYQRGVNKVAGTLTGLSLPSGVAVDGAGNVYVANFGAANIPVYAKGSTTLLETLDDSGHLPVDVAVGSLGTVYVANLLDANSSSGSVSIYYHGSKTVSRVLHDPNFGQVQSVAVDEHRRLIACYNTASAGACDAFMPGQHGGVTVVTSSSNAMEGAAFDSAGNLAVQNLFAGTQYYNTSYALCGGDPLNGEEMYLAFDRSNGDIYKTNANGSVEENSYAACSGATAETTYSAGLNGNVPYGVAIDPGSGI